MTLVIGLRQAYQAPVVPVAGTTLYRNIITFCILIFNKNVRYNSEQSGIYFLKVRFERGIEFLM